MALWTILCCFFFLVFLEPELTIFGLVHGAGVWSVSWAVIGSDSIFKQSQAFLQYI